MTVEKVISGGQTGADQGGLFGAKAAGVLTSGYVPHCWWTETGPAPWLADYNLIELPTASYSIRTSRCVAAGDGTTIFGDFHSSGSVTARAAATVCRRPVFPFPFPVVDVEPTIWALRRWLEDHRITIWNVAGNRESTNPGIELFVANIVEVVLTRGT